MVLFVNLLSMKRSKCYSSIVDKKHGQRYFFTFEYKKRDGYIAYTVEVHFRDSNAVTYRGQHFPQHIHFHISPLDSSTLNPLLLNSSFTLTSLFLHFHYYTIVHSHSTLLSLSFHSSFTLTPLFFHSHFTLLSLSLHSSFTLILLFFPSHSTLLSLSFHSSFTVIPLVLHSYSTVTPFLLHTYSTLFLLHSTPVVLEWSTVLNI